MPTLRAMLIVLYLAQKLIMKMESLKKYIIFITLGGCCFSASTVFAVENIPAKYDLILRGGLAMGGDNVESWSHYYPSMSNPIITDNPGMRAGTGLFLGVGIEHYFESKSFSMEISGEHHTSFFFIFPDTSTSEFKKLVFNIIPSLSLRGHKFGLGLTYHHNPVYSDSAPSNAGVYNDRYLGDISPVVKLEFNNSLGAVAQYTYGKGIFKVGIRATSINYKTDSLSTQSQIYNENTIPKYSRTISGNNLIIFAQLSF